MTGKRLYLEHDWFSGGIPGNVVIEDEAYVDSSHCFEAFRSERTPGCIVGEAAGIYDRSALVVGPRGRVVIGPYTCLNATYLICNDEIAIGAHCLFAWGCVITDSWLEERTPLASRRQALKAAAADPLRTIPPVHSPKPVSVEDNVWVGFDCVILPGVTLGRGCLIGCATVVAEDVPPYAVVAGTPARVVRFLEPDDTEEARARAFRDYTGSGRQSLRSTGLKVEER